MAIPFLLARLGSRKKLRADINPPILPFRTAKGRLFSGPESRGVPGEGAGEAVKHLLNPKLRSFQIGHGPEIRIEELTRVESNARGVPPISFTVSHVSRSHPKPSTWLSSKLSLVSDANLPSFGQK